MIDLPLSVTPLEMLSLAWTRRFDRDLAMHLATLSAAQSTKPREPIRATERTIQIKDATT